MIEKINEFLNSDDNPYKKLADKYDVERIDIETLMNSDAIAEYLVSCNKILIGVMKMGIRVYELSIPTMVGVILKTIRMGPKACDEFAQIMVLEYKKFIKKEDP